MCVEVGHVRVDEARGRLQTKTKHYNTRVRLICGTADRGTAEPAKPAEPIEPKEMAFLLQLPLVNKIK